MQTEPSGRHAVIVFYVVIAVLVVVLWRFPPANSAEVAAWVQGGGTLAAVGAASWAGRFPAMQTARQAKAARDEFAQDVTDVLDFAEKGLVRVTAAIEAGDYRRTARSLETVQHLAIQPSIADLLATRRAGWPSRDCYSRVFTLNRMLAVLLADEVGAPPPANEAAQLAYLSEQLDTIFGVIERAREEIARR